MLFGVSLPLFPVTSFYTSSGACSPRVRYAGARSRETGDARARTRYKAYASPYHFSSTLRAGHGRTAAGWLRPAAETGRSSDGRRPQAKGRTRGHLGNQWWLLRDPERAGPSADPALRSATEPVIQLGCRRPATGRGLPGRQRGRWSGDGGVPGGEPSMAVAGGSSV